MAEDLVKELRSIVADGDMYGVKAEHPTSIHLRTRIEKAADRIEALEAENARQKAALTFYRDNWLPYKQIKSLPGFAWKPNEALLDDCGEAARSALTGKGA